MLCLDVHQNGKGGVGSGLRAWLNPQNCSWYSCCRECIGVNRAESENVRMNKKSENSVTEPV